MQQDLIDLIEAAAGKTAAAKPVCDGEARPADAAAAKAPNDDPVTAIFDSVTVALLSVNDNGIIRSCNRVCGRYFGVDYQQLIGSPVSSLLPGATGIPLAEFLQPYLTSFEDSRVLVVNGEVDALTNYGEQFTAEISASELDIHGDNVYVICLRDVSRRKAADDALRENEARYRALVDNAPEAILVLDIDDNRFIDANDNACTLFNLSRPRLLTVGPEAISPIVQQDGTPSFGVRRGLVDQALEGAHPVFEWLHTDSDGKEIPCEVRFSLLPAEDRRLIRVCICDISERKRNETLTYAQNKILEMIIENQPHDRTLRAICNFVEKIGDGFRASVMQLDRSGDTLSVLQAPNLPADFLVHLSAVRVSASSIACGSAVFHQQDRITIDIKADSNWSGLADLTDRFKLASVWSFVVRGDAGRPIGTLDVYSERERVPSTDQLDKLTRMARLAGIAIKRQQDEGRLLNSEARYRGLFENVLDGVYIATRNGEIITANPALVEMLGFSSVAELRGAGSTSVLYVNPLDRERVFARLEAQGFVKNFEYRLRRKDGSEIVVLENSRAVFDESGEVVAHEGTITDITERKRAETQIFEEKERAQVTLQSIGDGVITSDAEGRVDYINPVAEDLTGWDKRSAHGMPVSDLMMLVNAHTRASVDNPVMRCLEEGRAITLPENTVLITNSGEEVPIKDTAAPIRDRIGNIIGAVMVFHDVSKESRMFRQLSYQAAHDALTGLFNRREFENRLMRAIDTVRDNNDETHALLYADLDQFKVVNDTFGHIAGDALLMQLSELIQSCIRSGDTIARLGGDEFGILLEKCDEKRALEVAEGIRSAVERYRFEWQDAFMNVRCSFGVVMVNSDNADVAALMSSADVACYSAKDTGRNQVHLYKDSQTSLRHAEMKWVSRITSAVEEGRFELYYQPIIAVNDDRGQPRGHYELLLRMRDEEGNIVGPNQFIPAAERYNLMSMLDRWVIHEALSELADRNRDGEARYTLAINLSGTSLSEDRFLEYVINEFREQQLPAGAICFEITETAAISNLSRVVYFMQALKKLGCRFSLDDFGSGLSSFTYLKNLPVDYLKIDGHFVQHIAEDNVDESMVKAISEVGRALGIETIAERVENQQVLDKLGTLGVEFAQGYYIARPASVASFQPWVDETHPRLLA